MAHLQATVSIRGGQPSIPRPRGTSGAIAQQPVGLLLPDKDSSTTRDQGSNASVVSVSIASIAIELCRPRHNPTTLETQPRMSYVRSAMTDM